MSYFNIQKKRQATDTLRVCYECAEAAGIRKALFVSYGLLLGIVREKDYIPWDNDIDMCVRRDWITAEQELKYYKLLEEAGLFGARRKWSTVKAKDGFPSTMILSNNDKSGDPVRLTWFSLRPKPHQPKFCHWFMFPWNGYMWHTKAGKWVQERKFTHKKWDYKESDEAIMKGCPVEYLDELMDFEFYGLDIRIPKRAGSCLDFMYPGWLIPRRRGASSKKIVCVVGKWDDKSTWRIFPDQGFPLIRLIF